MNREIIIDNLDDMCALMCDNYVRDDKFTIKEVDELPYKTNSKHAIFKHTDCIDAIDTFIAMGVPMAEVILDDTGCNYNNVRRQFQTACNCYYGIKVSIRGNRIFLIKERI